MLSIRIILAAAVLALAAATPAQAQGRHDEKPHGVMKPTPDSEKETRQAGTGGRHDEGPTSHGKKRAAGKKATNSKKTTEAPADATPVK